MGSLLLENYRRAVPNDARPDDEVTLEIAEKWPDALEEFPDFKADYERLIAPPPPRTFVQPPPTGMDIAKNVVGSATRSFFGGIADIPEAIGVLNAELSRKTGGVVDLTRMTVDRLAHPNAEESWLSQAGPAIRKLGAAIAAEPEPELQESFLATKVPEFIGSAAAFMATGGAGRAVTSGSRIGATGLKLWALENAPIAAAGALSQANGAYKEALSKSGDRDTALNAYLLNLPIGASEIIPLSRMLNRLDGVSGGTFTKTLVNAGKESFEEAAQEAGQAFASNYVAKKLYDKDRNLLEDLQENAAGGGIVGFLFSTLTQSIGLAIGGRRGQFQEPPGTSKSSSDLPPGLITGATPPAAGQPPAPAGPAASPIAKGMTELTGTITPEDDLALRTWAKQDIEGTLPETDRAARDNIFARNPSLSSAYAIYRQDAEKAAEIEAAASKTDTAPTEAQKESGNYAKGKVNIEGVGTVSIENPKGSLRTGKDKDGEEWSVTMPATYGYILGTKGKDKDHLDVYLGDNPETAPEVYVVNQVNPETDKFDEHKIFYGFSGPAEATAAYDAAFSDGSGPFRRGSVIPMTREEFQTWLKEGDHTKPVSNERKEPDPLIAPPAIKETLTLPDDVPSPAPLEGQPYDTTISPPPTAPTSTPPVAEVVPTPSATRTVVPPVAVPAAVDVFSMVNDQVPDHASLEGKPTAQIEQLITRNAQVKEPVIDENGARVMDAKGKPKTKTLKSSMTMRMTFFEDTQTGKIIGLGTYENQQQSKGGVRVAYVGRAPGYKHGMPFRTFIEGGNTGPKGATKVPAGRYKPLYTVRLNAPVDASTKGHGIAFGFENREEYQSKLGEPLLELEARNASYEETKGVVQSEDQGEYTGAPRTVTAVDEATPATALEAKEGFTPDEAKAIYAATRGIKKNSPQDTYSAIAKSPDALDAAKKMLAVIGPLAGTDEEAAHILLEWIYEAQTLSKGKEKGFVDALTSAVSSAGTQNSGRGGATATGNNAIEAPATPGVGPVNPVNPPGAEPGASGRGGQGEAAGDSGEANEVRKHTPPAGFNSQSLPSEISERFRATLFAAAQQGLNVTVVQQGTAGIAEELSGMYGQEAGQRLAIVGVNDVAAPNIESLYVLTAEVAHDVFAGLSESDRARLQTAVRFVTDAALGITGENLSVSESIPEGERAAVMQEERLVDATTRALLNQGFNPAEAQGFARALWRAIKDLILRAARVLHEAWMGATSQTSGEAGARMAQAYFENRVKSWLSGDARALSLTDFMGGGSTRLLPMLQRRGTWFTPAYGQGITWRWNPETFALESSEASADSVGAMRANLEMPTIRYHRNSVARLSPDQGPEIRIPDFAAQNELESVLQSQFAEFNAQGHNVTATGQPAMTQDEFNAYVLPGTMDSPAENKAGWSAEMQRVLGRSVPNENVRMGALNPATKIETANKAVVHLNKIRSFWNRRDNEASESLGNDPGSTQSRSDKQALRVVNLTNNYTDAEFLFSEMKENVTGWLRWLRDGLRQGFTEGRAGGRQLGVLEQGIKEIEGRIDKPIATQYAATIDSLVKRFAADEEHRTRFVVMMQHIAALPGWFELSSRATVREYLRTRNDPALAGLQQDTPESRALLTIAVSFTRANSLAMHMLALRGEAKTDELLAERATLNGIIKAAISDNREAFKNARRDASKLNKLRSRADAILNELEKAKDKQRILHDELMAARRFTEFYRTNAPLLDQQIAAMESVIGAERNAFEATEGSTFSAPENAKQSPKEWKTLTFNHTRDGTQAREIAEAQRRIESWLAAHPAGDPFHGGADYNYAESTLNKLRDNAIDGKQHEHVRRVAQALFGPMTVKLEQTGIPALKNAARRLRGYLSLREQHYRPSDVKAVSFSNIENKAMKALGYGRGQIQNFRKLMDQAWYYFSQRKDLLYGAGSDAAGKDLRINATLDFLHLNGKKREAMNSLLREWGDQSQYYTALSERMGNKVDDDSLGMLRSSRGAWGEVMRMMSGAVDVVATEMIGQGGAGGAWANDPFRDIDVAGEYSNDPNDLRQRLAPLFSPPNVWKNFVAPIANRPGTAMFNGPEDNNGFSPPARVEDVKRAFNATQPGDIVAFAENLFTVMGGTGDRGAFIASTIDVFNGVFKEIKAQKSESSMASGNNMENVTQLLMNARRGENWPPEFLTYRPFDLRNTRSLVNHLSFHAAFGRNMVSMDGDFASGINDLRTMSNRLAVITDEALKEKPNATPSQLRVIIEKKANDSGNKIHELQKASISLAMVEQEQKTLRSFINSQGGVALEFRAFTEMISAGVAAVVQGPATHLIDTISLFKPIQIYGVSTQGLKFTAHNVTGYLKSRAGSLMELFGKTVVDDAGYIRRAHDMGVMDTAAQHTLKERITAVIMNASVPESAPLLQRLSSYFAIVGRSAREFISTGIPTASKTPLYPRIKPFGTFTSGTQHMLMGSTVGTWRTYEEMAGRAVQYFEQPQNSAARNDDAFRFLPEHASYLGYSNKFLGILQDKAAFATMLNALNQHGLTLEGLAKDYLARKAGDPTAPMLTDRAFAKLLPLAPTEILQESSLGSRPSVMITNPVLHNGLPLVGWAVAQTGSVFSSFSPKLGPGDWKDFSRGLWAFAAMMGVGMAYALMRDLYDEELLGKKANRLTLGHDNTALALIDRADQVGSLGILGSAANSMINKSTARDFSIDSRVFAVSMAMNLMRATSDWYHQGGTATYATVGRPVLQSLGGSGYMQYAQILNRITGSATGEHLPGFEQEARMTARINAANWLRVAGRGLDMEVRTNRGASDSVPNKVTPWAREMSLAAYGNDPSEFYDAYRKAVMAAREEGKPDPQDFVKRAYESQHPLRSIFKTQLSEADVRRLLSSLPEDGRQDVMEAVRLFNRFGEMTGSDSYWGRAEKKAATTSPLRSIADVLRSQARLPAISTYAAGF